MLRTTIVIWLVLLVLALNVVAFVTRIAEKCRLAITYQNALKEPFLSCRVKNRRS
jgi:hypothetical protein